MFTSAWARKKVVCYAESKTTGERCITLADAKIGLCVVHKPGLAVLRKIRERRVEGEEALAAAFDLPLGAIGRILLNDDLDFDRRRN